MAGSKPISGRTHTGATEQAATMAVSQEENTPPPAPKRASALFRSHSHHQHSPCSVVGMALATCFPHTPLQGRCPQCMNISVLRWL